MREFRQRFVKTLLPSERTVTVAAQPECVKFRHRKHRSARFHSAGPPRFMLASLR